MGEETNPTTGILPPRATVILTTRVLGRDYDGSPPITEPFLFNLTHLVHASPSSEYPGCTEVLLSRTAIDFGGSEETLGLTFDELLRALRDKGVVL